MEVDDPTSTPPHKARALATASGSPSPPSGLAALKGKAGGLLAAVAASVSEGGHGVEQCDFRIVEAVSMRSKHRASEAKTKRKVLSILRLVGKDSLVFAEVLGSRSDVSEAESHVMVTLNASGSGVRDFVLAWFPLHWFYCLNSNSLSFFILPV